MRKKQPSTPFFIIEKKGTLRRLQKILDEFQMYDMNNQSVFLLYGYKTLSAEAKETYYSLKTLQNIASSKKKGPGYIEVSLDYLATVFNTTTDCQSQRIAKLEQHGLVSKDRRSYQVNRYYIHDPLPDSTFVQTICSLIRRKKLGQLLSKLKSTNNTQEKIDYITKIKVLQERGAWHYQLSSPETMSFL
jgi:hypothetical protein